jgi:predicted nucleic acid-binding Zn ribbon protein
LRVLPRRDDAVTMGRDREVREPAPVSEAMGRLVAERGWGERMALGRLKARWADIVGQQVAARSEPIRLEDGRLTIRVESGAWAAELALLGSSLASSAAHFLGPGKVREVAVVAGSIGRR